MSKPDFAPSFIRGVEHFNALEFWEAHEAWEELWLEAESDLVLFLQGLIQVAAAYHHVKRGTFRGAVRLFDAGLAKLAPFPLRYCGIDREAMERTARQHRTWTAEMLARGGDERLAKNEYPRIALVKPNDDVPMPPSSSW